MPQMKKMTKSECTWNRLLCPFSHSFVIRHSCFVIFLIHVALVTLVAFELLDVLIGLINGFTALLLHDFSRRRTRKSGRPRRRAISKSQRHCPSSDVGHKFSRLDRATKRNRAV